MAESTEEIYDNNEEKKHKEEEEDNNDTESLMHPNSSFLLDMNLVLIVASLTLPNQELLEFENSDNTNGKDLDAKAAYISKLKTQKREFDQLKVPDKQTQRLQTRVLDSRHGRKM